MNRPAIPPKLGLLIAVIALSFPAIFIRLSGADGLSIAFLRLTFASIILLPIAARKIIPAWKALNRAQRWRVVWAGCFLGIHLLLWVTSVTKTTVASAAFLIITQPVMVAILAHFLLKEHINRWIAAAVALALAGSALINSGDLQLGPQYLWGDFLSLAGAVMAAFYLLSGRYVRREINLLPYITLIYSIASLTLLPFCIILKAPLFSLTPHAYFWILMLTLIPTLIGHSMYNWALRYLKTFTVNAGIIIEPIIATTLAWFLFQERPSSLLYPGAILLIVSLLLAFKGEES